LTLRERVHRFTALEFVASLSPLHEDNAMAVGKTSDASFEADVLKSSEPVVVDFWAEWCGPCRMIAPALDEISGQVGDKVKIVKLNVDENPNTAAKYGIMSIPTLLMFKNGEISSRQVGAAPKQKLHQWISGAA
jgi:thioredoxin 1